jgi:hypothetical protein
MTFMLVEPSFDLLDSVAHVASNPNTTGAVAAAAPPVDRRERDPEKCGELIWAQQAPTVDRSGRPCG